MTSRSPSHTPVAPATPAEVVEIERALARIAHLIGRARQHGHIAAEAGVPVERAAVPVLRLLSDAGPMRPGELATRLAVEAPHVTRQVQRLVREGYVRSFPDPNDGRAQLVELTAAGAEAHERILEVRQRWMEEALSDWSSHDLRQLATLFHRMVDDFLAQSQRVDADR
ncbi:MarR family winged helix-turn-helix transcriptional regulator [Streptomyces sp. 4N509B]|uniref:MarR family winged helix-turn-helix transcriptional regulator n=1 Tax=Streptomyces sp. 4N509B TaxID=3457413 RepID=UPI003FD52EB9